MLYDTYVYGITEIILVEFKLYGLHTFYFFKLVWHEILTYNSCATSE